MAHKEEIVIVYAGFGIQKWKTAKKTGHGGFYLQTGREEFETRPDVKQ